MNITFSAELKRFFFDINSVFAGFFLMNTFPHKFIIRVVPAPFSPSPSFVPILNGY